MTVTAHFESSLANQSAPAAINLLGNDHPFFGPSGAENNARTPGTNVGDSFPRTLAASNTGVAGLDATQPQSYLDAPPANTGFVAGDSTTLEIPPISGVTQTAPEMPAPIQQAIAAGRPIRFSSAGEDQQANRQPDYFFTPEGQLVANPNATPSADGSINIEIQSKDQTNNQSLRDAIQHESAMQRQAAQEMMRLFEKAHPGQPIPSWMRDLAEATPNLPDFVPFNPPPHAPAAPPPENGFVNRGVSPGGGGAGNGGGAGDGGFSGFAGNGGFDNKGYFQGNGGNGDGTLSTGGTDSRGQPLGAGEQVQAKQLYDYFTQHGFSPAQASGILGNIQTESSFRTNAHNAAEGAIGLCQWEGGRRTALESFAAHEGKPVTDWHVQADFIMHELNTTEKGAFAAIKAAQTPDQAALAFQSKYERSASLGDRAANASNIYRQLA